MDYFYSPNIRICRVSTMSRRARTEWFMTYSLTSCFFGTKCKLTRIFTFISACQGVQNTSQIFRTQGIVETLVRFGTSILGITDSSRGASAIKRSRFVCTNHTSWAYFSILTFIDILTTLNKIQKLMKTQWKFCKQLFSIGIAARANYQG